MVSAVSLRPIGSFRADLSADEIGCAEAARIRSLATWAAIKLMPGFLFLRQRSEFIQGWEAAASAGASLTSGASAGAVGAAGVPALGSWMMLPNLTDERTQTVLPMNDSLYGAAQLELDRSGSMVIGVPECLPDRRYWSIAVHDAFLNCVAHLGPKWTGDRAGEYLLVGPDWDGPVPPWATGVMRSPTVSVLLLNRVLVGYEPGDIDVVRRWRDGLTLTTPAARAGGSVPAIETADLIHGDLRGLDDPVRFLRLGFEHLAHNPPAVEDRWLVELLRSGGLEAADDDARRAAVTDGVRDAQLILDGAISGTPRRDGWTVPFAHTGEPGPYVLEQAVTQLRAIGANDPAEAVYLFADRDGDGEPLDGSGAAYELRFEMPPPLDDPGFWSLTMYGPDSLLVNNPIGRYSTRVSRPGFVRGADGSATVVMSARLPDDVPEANWLPAPPGPFQVGLRLYYPRPAIRDGSWFPPPVRRAPYGRAQP